MQSRRKDQAVGGFLSIVLLFGAIAVVEAGAPTEQMRQTVNDLVAIFGNPSLDSPDRAQERRAQIQQVL